MKGSILKKLLTLFLALVLLSSITGVYAIMSPGPAEYELDRSYLLNVSDATLSGEKIVFSVGGVAKFDLLLPFDADKLELTYEAVSSDTETTIITEENIYQTILTAGETKKTVAITELVGSNTITLRTNKAVTITGVKFLKVNENYNQTNSGEVPLTDYEYALLSSVVFKDNAPIVKARGAIQRLDYDSIGLTPMNVDGRLYVPFSKLAETLGYYSEDYIDKAYLYMAGETESMALVAGKGYIESDKDGRSDFSLYVIYKDSRAWVPVRKLAEAFGFTVCYRDGYVVIDDRLAAKKVVEKEDFFTELKSEFTPYIAAEKVTGKTYHVAKTNNAKDTNTGTENAPLLTIQEAANRAVAGDTVIIHKGIYRETVTPQNNGTAQAPIVFKAAGDGDVVISALEKIGGFSSYQGDIVKTTVTEDLGFGRNQLFYKGEALNAGRHPNGDTKPGVVPYPKGVPEGLYATRGNIRITEENGNVAYSDTDLDQPENFWNGGTFVTLKGQGWCLVSGDIVSSEPGKLILKDHDGTKSFNLGLVLVPNSDNAKYFTKVHDSDYGYITNHINTLDVEGEWHIENHSLYMIPPKDADIENDFEIKQRQLCIDLRDKKFITFDGINTIGGGITMSGDNTEGLILNNGTFKYIAHHSVLLDQSNYAMYADEPNKSLRTIKNGEAGICVAGKNSAIVNSTIDYSSATGINLIGKYTYVNNNVISNTSYSGGYPGGIKISPDTSKGNAAKDILVGGHFITHNTLYNAGRSLLLQGSTVDGVAIGVSPVEIAYNRFYNGALSSRDTGVTYEYGFTGGNDKAKTRMHHNFIYNPGYKDIDTESMLFMLYQDGLVAARDTYSNVTYFEEIDKAPANQVYVQKPEFTVIRNRNNATLGYLPNGEADIKTSMYPGARTFEPGAYHDQYPRSMDSYDDFIQNYKPYYPSAVSSDNKTFTFENVNVEGGKRMLVGAFLTRKIGETAPLNITAKLYNGETLIQTTSFTNALESQRFYVHDLHRGLVFINPVEQGVYRLELEMSDDTVDVKKITLESYDPQYDNVFTKEMEQAGAKSYVPKTSTGSEKLFPVTQDFNIANTILKNNDEIPGTQGLKVHATGNEWGTMGASQITNGALEINATGKPYDITYLDYAPNGLNIESGKITIETVISEMSGNRIDLFGIVDGDGTYSGCGITYNNNAMITGKIWEVPTGADTEGRLITTPSKDVNGNYKLRAVIEREDASSQWSIKVYDLTRVIPVLISERTILEAKGLDNITTIRVAYALPINNTTATSKLLLDSLKISGGDVSQETLTFENVYIEAGKKTALKLNVARDFAEETQVQITAKVYDSTNAKVEERTLV
ncbi:MAG: hypothetical protein IKB60_01485, partial [Clostridia bacterium]|nr:hypothetical protein [Clostridia bacterium]